MHTRMHITVTLVMCGCLTFTRGMLMTLLTKTLNYTARNIIFGKKSTISVILTYHFTHLNIHFLPALEIVIPDLGK
jgi:hypothetical protein